jgi:ABC-type bacteriocin/lantibiotic exporter with double-glycine peptidase domain
MDENAIADAVLAVARGTGLTVQKDEESKTIGDGTQITAQSSENAEEGAVHCDNLSFVYNPKSPFETHALDNVRLEIQSGDFFGIIGHTGSGKSTFVQHLNALLKVPTAQKKYKAKKPKKGQPIPPKTV